MSRSASLPALSCDCHVHIVGAEELYPMIGERQYTPGFANVEELKSHMSGLGLDRAVIVQPSFYGTDNRCMLDALRQLDGAGRGVAVAEHAISTTELHALHLGGVRGLRINVESSHGGEADHSRFSLENALATWAKRLAPVAHLGWHLQVFAGLDLILACEAMIRKLPFELVLDHFAMIPTPVDISDKRIASLVDLFASGKLWIKLSAPYRPPTNGEQRAENFVQLAKRLIEVNPTRLVWGSDWPHTQREPEKSRLEISAYRTIPPETLAHQIHEWLPMPSLLEQVLVSNPARLYQF
jgi:predicted TIM-barrel fold metal-dependent hydrolase